MTIGLSNEERRLLIRILPKDHPLRETLKALPRLEKRASALCRRIDRLGPRSRKSAVQRLRRDVEAFSATLGDHLSHEGVHMATMLHFLAPEKERK